MNKQQLAEEYAFKQMWYSLSFKERLMIKFGWLKVDPQTPPKYYRMNCKELKKAIDNIKKPWWDKMVKYMLIWKILMLMNISLTLLEL